MKIRYLGTAAAEGVPAIFCKCAHCEYARKVGGREIRTRAGSLLDGVLKLDFGPDSYKHALDFGLDYSELQSVVVTHSHEDHFDFEDVGYRRDVFAHLPDNQPPMTVYGNAAVGAKIEPWLNPHLKFEQVHALQPVEIEGYTVTPLEATHCISGTSDRYPVIHGGKTYYRSEEAFTYLIEKDGQSLLYAHDTSEFTPDDMALLANRHIDLISLDCTNGVLDLDYVGHMGANDLLRLRDELFRIGAADEHTVFVANHFSHNGLVPHDQLQALLPGFIVTYDGLEVEV